MRLFKITSMALSLSLGAFMASAPVVAASNNLTVIAQAKATHQKGASHKHCHKRLRGKRLVTICHNHRHWPLHHTRKRG